MNLPRPHDLTSLVLRTDFGDDAAWQAAREAIDSQSEYGSATFVSDPAYAGLSVNDLVAADARASEPLNHLFVADSATMADPGTLLAVDLLEEPGRTFRLPPRWFDEVSANLCIANMDFADYADATDATGTFRGFPEA